MEQNKSNFAIPAEQRQKWYSIALVWIGAMICVSSLMVGGMLGNGMKLGFSCCFRFLSQGCFPA